MQESFTSLNQAVGQTGIGAAILANISALLVSYAKYLKILLFTNRNRELETGSRISQVGVCKWEVKRIPVFNGNKETARSLRQLPFCVVVHPFTVL